MKKTALLFIFALTAFFMRAGMSNSIEYGQLYIVGEATATSWDLGSAASMSKIANGVFEWTGRLTGGKDFKFMNTREAWHKHIVSVKSDVVAEIGKTYSLNFFANWALDGKYDCKFKVAETGNYTITVDLTSMRMSISKPAETIKWPEKFYLVGSATDNKIIEIPDFYGIEHKKTVNLQPGFVKLIDTPTITDKTRYFIPRFPEVDITFGKGLNVYLYEAADINANGWSVTVPGEYMIYLDNGRHTFTCKRFIQYNALYIVGGCCELAWNYWDESNNRFIQDAGNPDVMVWEGELRIGWAGNTVAEPNKFKILTAQSWFEDTYHPYKADMPVEGNSDARITGGDDLKWTIKRDGYYRMEFNTKTEVLKATYIQSSDVQGTDGSQTAETPDVEISEEAGPTSYYNLQGIKISKPQSGLYIVNDGNKTKKCLMR